MSYMKRKAEVIVELNQEALDRWGIEDLEFHELNTSQDSFMTSMEIDEEGRLLFEIKLFLRHYSDVTPVFTWTTNLEDDFLNKIQAILELWGY